jgi:hypothetical protein
MSNFTHHTVFAISYFNQQGECVNTQTETLEYPASEEHRYTVKWFVNNECTYTVKNIRAGQAYDLAIPPEALLPVPGNRWHVMMRQHALEQCQQLDTQNSMLTVCYQDPLVGYDTERVIILREQRQN